MTKRYSNSWHAWPEKSLDVKEKEKVEEVKNEISFNEEEFKKLIVPILSPMIKKATDEKKLENEKKLQELIDNFNKLEEIRKEKYNLLESMFQTRQNQQNQQNQLMVNTEERTKTHLPLWVPITISVLASTTFFLFIFLLFKLFF